MVVNQTKKTIIASQPLRNVDYMLSTYKSLSTLSHSTLTQPLAEWFYSYVHIQKRDWVTDRDNLLKVTQWWRGNIKLKIFTLEPDTLTPMWDFSSELKKDVNQFDIKLKNDEEKFPIRVTMTFLPSGFVTKGSESIILKYWDKEPPLLSLYKWTAPDWKSHL